MPRQQTTSASSRRVWRHCGNAGMQYSGRWVHACWAAAARRVADLAGSCTAAAGAPSAHVQQELSAPAMFAIITNTNFPAHACLSSHPATISESPQLLLLPLLMRPRLCCAGAAGQVARSEQQPADRRNAAVRQPGADDSGAGRLGAARRCGASNLLTPIHVIPIAAFYNPGCRCVCRCTGALLWREVARTTARGEGPQGD